MTMCNVCWLFILIEWLAVIYHTLGYERVYLPLCEMTDTPFYIQGDDAGSGHTQPHALNLYHSSFDNSITNLLVYLFSDYIALPCFINKEQNAKIVIEHFVSSINHEMNIK